MNQIELDGKWTFVPADGREPPLKLSLLGFSGWFNYAAELPGAWNRQPDIPPFAHAAGLLRDVTIPDAWAGQRVFLRFAAVNDVVAVLVDDVHVATHRGPYSPFEVDLTDYVTPGQTHKLRLDIVDRSFFTGPDGWQLPPGPTWTVIRQTDVARGVLWEAPRLEGRPLVRVSDVVVRADVAREQLHVEVTVANSRSHPVSVPLTLTLDQWAGSPDRSFDYPDVEAKVADILPGQESTVRWSLPWTLGRESWWWPNIPFDPDFRATMHLLTPVLDGQAQQPVRFGFVEAGQSGNRYLLNGIGFNLRGDNWTLEGPDFEAGRTPRAVEVLTHALDMLLRDNINVIRTHALPAPEWVLDVCDERGVCVISENAIYASMACLDTSDLTPWTDHVREVVRRDRHHPSVFKYSVLNEGAEAGLSREFALALHDAARAEDPVRPISFDESRGLDFGAPLVDIQHYSYKEVPGKPDGHPAHHVALRREDRPYGQGEFLFGAGSGDGRVGMVLMAMRCRAHRLNGEADIRPHTFEKQYGLFGENKTLDPADPTVERARSYVRRSLAPVAAFDLAYDDLNWHPGAEGATPVYVPEVVAGSSETRRVAVLNDELEGESLTLEWSCGDSRGSQELTIPRGTFDTVDLELTWPAEAGPTVVSLSVLKNGRTAYSSEAELQFLVLTGAHNPG